MSALWPRRWQIVLASFTIVLAITGCKENSSTAPPIAKGSTPESSVASSSAAPASYQAAKYDPIHFKPAIDKASDQQCLACHAEVLKPSVKKRSSAGVESATATAWYQQTPTYQGDQDTFHRRHLTTALAKQVMNLRCTTCHQGNDPREEASGSSATTQSNLTLRKMVNPETTCLKCHGKLNWPVMGLPGPWEQSKHIFQNNCLLCHSNIRTNRHQVSYLNAKVIEEIAAKPDGGNVCFGCHGGRSWYRTHYPYPRHAWPGMGTEVPDWAKERPTESEVRFITNAMGQGEKNEWSDAQSQTPASAVRFPSVSDSIDPAGGYKRRDFLKIVGATTGAATLIGVGITIKPEEASAFAYEPYLGDDQLTTVVTSCAHNCGSRHVLVAHKKGDVIVRLSTDNGQYQAGGSYGKDTEAEPQLRACLRGRSYRARLYSPERLLYPMKRVGARGEHKFKRISWDQALSEIAAKMVQLKKDYGPTAILDQAYAGASYGVLHKSDQIEGLLARFLGMFGCRTNSWSVHSYQATTFSSRMTFGTIQDGNEDDTFAHSKLIIMWGWNPAYTFHGGNTFYYMRMAKQRGCKFVLIDPQYTDSAAVYDAWWIPIKPNTDAAMMAAMAHHIFSNNLHDQKFIDRFVLGMDAGTLPKEYAGKENFKDYILGKYDNTPKTPEWAEQICGVKAEDIRKLADMYAKTKPAALKASWAPGRASYGEQYNRMAAALQAMTGNIGVLGGCAEGVGKAWHSESVAYPYDENANLWWASIKSDRWAHCVLNYPNVKREEIGLWPREDHLDGQIPNIKSIFWQGSDWFNQLTNINKEIKAIEKLELVVCMDSTITPSGIWADYLLPIATHFERHDVALPWYKGHYYIHRPKVIEPLGESKTDFQVFTELCYRLEALDPSLKDLGKRYNPKADRSYFEDPDAVDEAYLQSWWEGSVQHHQHVTMSWDEFKKHGTYKFILKEPHVAFREQISKGKPFETASGKIEIFSTYLAGIKDWTRTQFGYEIPYIPKWVEPFESLNHPIAKQYPFHLISPHPRWRTHSIFNNIPWLRETYEQEVTINASDAQKLGIKTGDTVEVWNDRGKCVAPAYVTERLLPGVLVLFEGAWMDPDKNGVDRAGNPDFLTLDNPSPAGAFAYNNAMVQLKKSDLTHRPGWDELAVARSSVFRRDM